MVLAACHSVINTSLPPQILWLPLAEKQESRNTYEGSLEIRDVHEVRAGKNSKDFDKWSDDNKRADSQSCFVVLYGQEFKLRTLSIVAYSPQERNMWIAGLKDMCNMLRSASYLNTVERWLRKEFYAMENPHSAIAQKDLKSFLSKLNCKISTVRNGTYCVPVILSITHSLLLYSSLS